jgi:hypothetical protein
MMFNATFNIISVILWRFVYWYIRRGRDRMVVSFTTTCVISAYHHYSCEFEPRS